MEDALLGSDFTFRYRLVDIEIWTANAY